MIIRIVHVDYCHKTVRACKEIYKGIQTCKVVCKFLKSINRLTVVVYLITCLMSLCQCVVFDEYCSHFSRTLTASILNRMATIPEIHTLVFGHILVNIRIPG